MNENNQKRIEVIENFPVSEINSAFGNPRKIKKKKKEELQNSLEQLGDFGLILIDEDNNVIAGNQRVSILKSLDPNSTVLVKRLIGYSQSELRAINVMDNTHSGEWDLDILAEWTSDLMLGLDTDEKPAKNKSTKDMEPLRYEKYDYVIICCRNEVDYKYLQSALGLDEKKVIITPKRKIKARAIWYEDIKAQIIRKDETDDWLKDGNAE